MEARKRPGGGKVPGAAPFVPPHASVAVLRESAQNCQGCDLYRNATQAVLGEGPAPARVMMIGEQPGDREDQAGQPFVGPAGRLLDKALTDAGIDRADVYLTNAVKHFKFEERGKMRVSAKTGEGMDEWRRFLENRLAAARR